jgi:Uma2 family endonuclease
MRPWRDRRLLLLQNSEISGESSYNLLNGERSMSTLLAPPKTAAPPTSPRKKRWTVDEFQRLSDEGWLDPGQTMLLDGEIIEMPIQNPLHSKGVNLADYSMKAVFASGFVVRVQQPLVLSLWTDPEPDIAVVAGSIRDFDAHPTFAALVLEVSDSTLAIDLGEKSLLYAAARIADYWVLDVNGRQLIVFRDPVADASIASGFRYATKLTLDAAATIAPFAAPNVSLLVADLLP